jgi:hypothetical protein
MFATDHPDAESGRLSRAFDLVEQGHVECSNFPGLWLVRSASRPNLAHRVANGLCSCEDARKRDARGCQHALAVLIFRAWERQDADRPIEIIVEPEDEAIPFALTPEALELLGEPCEVEPQPRARGGRITVLPLPAHLVALSEELFGPEPVA